MHADGPPEDWHFVVRWKKGNKLRPAGVPTLTDATATAHARRQDGVAAWQLTRGKRAWDQQLRAHPRNPHQPLTMGVLAKTRREPRVRACRRGVFMLSLPRIVSSATPRRNSRPAARRMRSSSPSGSTMRLRLDWARSISW